MCARCGMERDGGCVVELEAPAVDYSMVPVGVRMMKEWRRYLCEGGL